MPSSPTLTSLRWQSVPQKRPSVCCQRWLDTISPMPYPPGTTSRCLATNGIRGSEESSDGTASTGRPFTSGGQQFRSTTTRPSAYTAPPGPSWTPTASVTRPARMSPTRRYAGGYAAVANQRSWSRSPEPFRGRCPRYSTPSRCCYDSGSHSTTDPCHRRRSRVLGPASDGEEDRAGQRRVPTPLRTGGLPPASGSLGEQPGLHPQGRCASGRIPTSPTDRGYRLRRTQDAQRRRDHQVHDH